MRRIRVDDELLSYTGDKHAVVAVSSHFYTHKTLITTQYVDRKAGDVRFVTFPASVINENMKYQGKEVKRFVRYKSE